ncbi:MAG: fasciclin domain-containing protein [Pseudomonadota bacterium]
MIHVKFKQAMLGAIAAAAFATAPITASAKTVVDIAVGSEVHKTLVAAVTAAGLVDTLSSDGKFTVFAPTDAAFGKLPEGTVETLVEPANKGLLTKILTAHVVAGNVTASDLIAKINAHGGAYNFSAISGDALTAKLKGNHVYIFDESGGAALVTTADVAADNGVVHIVNDVLLPK